MHFADLQFFLSDNMRLYSNFIGFDWTLARTQPHLLGSDVANCALDLLFLRGEFELLPLRNAQMSFSFRLRLPRTSYPAMRYVVLFSNRIAVVLSINVRAKWYARCTYQFGFV